MTFRTVTPTAILACIVAFPGLPDVSLAQQTVTCDPAAMTELADLSQFENPSANWQIAGSVFSDPEREKNLVVTEQGEGVLANLQTNELKGNLFTKFEHGDLELELEVMVPKGSNSGIYLQGRYEIQVRDSWQVEELKPSDMGGIYYRFRKDMPRGQRTYEGTPPLANVAKPPGQWQKIRVLFAAPEFAKAASGELGPKTKNAVFREVWLNDILMHQDVEVTGPTRSSAFEDEKPTGPLMIQGDHGPVAYRNIRYRKLQKPLVRILE